MTIIKKTKKPKSAIVKGSQGKYPNLLTPEQRNLTSEEATRIGALGGKVSGITKRRNKSMKELVTMMGNMKANKKSKLLAGDLFPELGAEEVTNKIVMIARQMEKAIRDGDTKAFEVIRDTGGEKPVSVNEHSGLNGDSPENNKITVEFITPEKPKAP